MPILSRIGHRHARTRALRGGIALLLGLGALSMMYPFLLMLAGSTRSAADQRENDPLPDFLFHEEALYRKHIEGLFNENLATLEAAYDLDISSFETLPMPPPPNAALLQAWKDYLAAHPPDSESYTLGYLRTPISRTAPSTLRAFKRSLNHTYQGSIDKLNRDLNTDFAGWTAVHRLPADPLSRLHRNDPSAFDRMWRTFKAQQDPSLRVYAFAGGFYRHRVLRPQYGPIDQYNASHRTRFVDYGEIPLPARAPAGPPRVREDWEDAVRHTFHLRWIGIDESETSAWQAYLQARYVSIGHFNQRHQTGYAVFEEIPFSTRVPSERHARLDWRTFLEGWEDPSQGTRHSPRVDALFLTGPEFQFRQFLQDRHGTLEAANRALGTSARQWHQFSPPQQDAHHEAFIAQRTSLRIEFATRNYRAVIEYLLLHGRGLVNTLIYCLLAVLSALLVNPLAAYALSRYRLRHTYHLLLFMLLTMAFPPMVTQIPLFLLLRDLNLLNTFAALILPGLAHGYSIFLLKGFFDALPRELYESAQIDGAGEWTLFWRITMSLSKPILAVVALQAFTTAYANFMFALLLCQDRSMWTLMVWLYELQQRSGTGVLYASLVLSAIPPLLLFLLCQRIILRGIVIPVEK